MAEVLGGTLGLLIDLFCTKVIQRVNNSFFQFSLSVKQTQLGKFTFGSNIFLFTFASELSAPISSRNLAKLQPSQACVWLLVIILFTLMYSSLLIQ